MLKTMILTTLALASTQAFAWGATATRSFRVEPVITAAAYAQGDQMGGLTTLTDILPCSSCGISLKSIAVIDKAKTTDAFDIYFFTKEVALTSVDNGAFDVTDAVATNFAGKIAVAAADYVTLTSNSVDLKVLEHLLIGDGTKNLYMVLVCTDAGGCDYGAVDDLSIRLNYLE